MTEDKKDFIEAMLTWFRSPQVGNDEEIDREFLSDAYDSITCPRWISVDDELPKIGKDVLVLREDGEMQVAHQYNEAIARWWSVDGFPLKNNVTHWMHLPQPPKKGGEE